MTDPYQVLGVSPDADDQQIKEAYRALAKKYHPDQYADSPLRDLAEEKMKEINEAYDRIQALRREGGTARGGWYGDVRGGGNYADIRNLIHAGRITDAEQLLGGIPSYSRDAEWYFLKGTVLMRKGWLEDARDHLTRACQMDPGNQEYAAALNQLISQSRGMYGGYDMSRGAGSRGLSGDGCNACDVCSTLMIADCCCECMGGDLIPCC